MNLKWVVGLALGLMAVQVNAQDQATALRTEKDKVSYAIGAEVAKGLKSDSIASEVDFDMLVKGMRDVLTSGKPLMTDDEMTATLNTFKQEMTQKQAEDNKKAGDAFLAENAKKDGVVTQPSGLQYKILKAAEGKKPTDADTVICQYRGTLVDGTEFDSSYASAQPASFQIQALIPGIREALKLMQVGSKWQFVIPPGLAYGATGAGNSIGPNATLIFEIELLSIQGTPDGKTPAIPQGGVAPAR